METERFHSSAVSVSRHAWALLLPMLWGFCCPGAPLHWEQRDGYRVAELAVPKTDRAGFTLLRPEQTGLVFTNHPSEERFLQDDNLIDGVGVAAGDADGDSYCDLFFCNTEGSSALFRNLGNRTFEDVTSAAGVACSHQTSKGAVFADLNGDGALDLLVSSAGGPNACFFNDGREHFTNVTQAVGLVAKANCHSMALADIDGDGTLDLYITNYGEKSVVRNGGAFGVRYINGKPHVTGRAGSRLKIVNGLLLELGEPDLLYLNNGKGVFTPVSWTDGTFLTGDSQPLKEAPRDMGLSVMFRDLNDATERHQSTPGTCRRER